MGDLWFWQLIVSPHMAELAVAMAELGWNVTYVAQQEMSTDRAQQGWSPPVLSGVRLAFADSDDAVLRLVQSASIDSVHICQGMRANGRVGMAQSILRKRGLKQWVVMETVKDAGLLGILKRLAYRLILEAREGSLQGVLAIGYSTPNWIEARGISQKKIYEFTYFLPEPQLRDCHRESDVFKFVFVGRLVSLKRVDWLIKALAQVKNKSFELWIVGAGPEESALRLLASSMLGSRVKWVGQLPLGRVQEILAQCDCLVLPSIHDGWGAVVSEALISGTPAICSDACGVAGVVKVSGAGGVFPVGDLAALIKLLTVQLSSGRVTSSKRHCLATWASCLTADAGANYLHEILECKRLGQYEKPYAPWLAKEHQAV